MKYVIKMLEKVKDNLEWKSNSETYKKIKGLENPDSKVRQKYCKEIDRAIKILNEMKDKLEWKDYFGDASHVDDLKKRLEILNENINK